MAFSHLFGPVPSRRLGVSLGIDLVPHKVCTLNCVYCECGETTRLTATRDEYVPFQEVKEELERYLRENPAPDYITFSGSGEPVLNSRIGDVIRLVKDISAVPVAVLTNGTLFNDPPVRREILGADLVMPSLDAGSNGAFHRINRPHPRLDVREHIEGLAALRRQFSGEMWLEVFLLPGYNDCEENLNSLKEAIGLIEPHRVQLNTLDRPGAVAGLSPAPREWLEAIALDWGFPGTEVIASATVRKEKASFRKDVEEAIYETLRRRPCTLKDLCRILNLHRNEANKYLATLEDAGRIETTEMERGVFYRALR